MEVEVNDPANERIKSDNAVPTRRSVVVNHVGKAASVALVALGTQLMLTKNARALIPPCFLAGTKILTNTGERPIEDLAIGDLLPTMFGGLRPVKWIGRYHYAKSDAEKPWQAFLKPVLIAKSALAPNVPNGDLYVSQGHCFLIDDVLVPAGSLVNGRTICLMEASEYDEITYYHIKLEEHDVIYAGGAPCETLLGVGESAQNFADYIRRYGPLTQDDLPCAPVLCKGSVGEISALLRSAVSPWVGPAKLDRIRDRIDTRSRLEMAL